jgi:Tfp pilus assembly protein PilF
MAPQDWTRDRVPSLSRGQPAAAVIVCILLMAIVWIVFGQTVRYSFVNYDDQQYVYVNPQITRGLSFDGIRWAFTHVHAANWHPLTTVSHMLDCQLYGLQSWGHHFTNVLLHSLAVVLLFLAFRELTGLTWPSAVVAAVFAIHPLRVESVAWISERKDVLSGVFFMGTLWAYGRYVRTDRFSLGRYVMALALFALGLMSKPTLVTLPFVLLLLDYWPLQRLPISPSDSARYRGKSRAKNCPPWPRSKSEWSLRRSIGYLLLEKVPFFVLSAGSSLATLLAQQPTMITLHQLSFGHRLANGGISYVIYIRQMIWPGRLAVMYPYPQGGWSIIQVAVAFLLLTIISVLFLSCAGRYPFLLTGWLWFLGMLVPMIGLVQAGMQAHADRYSYLPQIGLCLVVIWGAMTLLGKWKATSRLLWSVVVLILIGLMTSSYVQASSWQDSETLWRRTLANTTDNYVAHTHLADVLLSSGRVDEAIDHLHQALKLSDFPIAYYHLGYALAIKDNWVDAITCFKAAIQVWPPYPQAHSNLGIGLAKLGKTGEALQEFNEAIRLDPNFRDAHYNAALLLLQLNRRDEAVAHFREVLRVKPDDAGVREQLIHLGAGH